MNVIEFLDEFNVLYNNINSNQAPGLNEYQISVFMTKAQDELLKNLFVGESAGNPNKLGMDMTEKRHIDFSNIMRVIYPQAVDIPYYNKMDSKSILYEIPSDILCIINETFYKSLIDVYNINGKILDVLASKILDDLTNARNVTAKQSNGNTIVDIAGNTITVDADKTYLIYTKLNKMLNLYNLTATVQSGNISNFRPLDGSSPEVGKVLGNFTAYNLPECITYFKNLGVDYKFGRVSQCAIVPLQYIQYTTLIGSPYKSPIRNQAWRLIGNNNSNTLNSHKIVEIIPGTGYYPANTMFDIKQEAGNTIKVLPSTYGTGSYVMRYIRKPKPIILFPNFDNSVSIDGVFGYDPNSNLDTIVPCELDSVLHKEIVQRAVELAKQAWNGDDPNSAQATTMRTTLGTRME